MEKAKITIEQIQELLNKMSNPLEELREQKIKRMIDFFGIQKTTDLTDVLVIPVLYQTFTECFRDVINVQEAPYLPESVHWQFFNFPTLKITPPDFHLETGESYSPKYESPHFNMKGSYSFHISDKEGIPINPNAINCL